MFILLNPEDNNLLIPDFGKKIKSITTYKSETKLKFKQDAFGITISVPKEVIDETDTILVIESIDLTQLTSDKPPEPESPPVASIPAV